eukprot:5620495-Prymnesium_polylepis.1
MNALEPDRAAERLPEGVSRKDLVLVYFRSGLHLLCSGVVHRLAAYLEQTLAGDDGGDDEGMGGSLELQGTESSPSWCGVTVGDRAWMRAKIETIGNVTLLGLFDSPVSSFPGAAAAVWAPRRPPKRPSRATPVLYKISRTGASKCVLLGEVEFVSR